MLDQHTRSVRQQPGSLESPTPLAALAEASPYGLLLLSLSAPACAETPFAPRLTYANAAARGLLGLRGGDLDAGFSAQLGLALAAHAAEAPRQFDYYRMIGRDALQLRVTWAWLGERGLALYLRDITHDERELDELRRRADELMFANESLTEQAGEVVELAEQTDMVKRALEREIEERKRLEAELRRLATTDPLTGAANRRHFLSVAEGEIARARRHQRPLSLILADIDRFKLINDTHGHAAGDQALQRFVDACNESLRQGVDLIGRIGGEEFVILLPETDAAGGQVVAERIRRLAAGLMVAAEGKRFGFTVSFGLAEWRLAEDTIAETLRRADAALYQAKESGRDRVVLAAD